MIVCGSHQAVTTAKGSSIIKGANGSNAKGKQSAKAKQSAKPKGAAKKDVVTPVVKKLTAKNLKAAQAEGLNELSLDQKLLKYQEDAAADVQLTGNDYTKLNLRFTQTALKKLPPQIQQAWQDASQGPGKQQRQHTILQAFGEDPTCGKHFLSKVQDFIESSKISVETQWISRKQLLAEFDESEAEELVEQGVLAVRKHPDNPSRLQYRRKKEFEVESREKSRKFIVATNMETDRQKAAWAVSQLRKGSLRRKSEAFEDESDDDDELGLAVPKKGEPKKKAEPKDPSKQKLKLDEAGLDSIADGDAETINDMAKKLSSYMHIALNSLKSQALLFQQTMYATPAKTKEVKARSYIVCIMICVGGQSYGFQV